MIVNKKKPKHLFGWKEFTQFTITFWTVDDKVFIHPRNKVQIPERKDDIKKGLHYWVTIASLSG